MSDSGDADTEDYEPPEERWLESDEWMEAYEPTSWNQINRSQLSEVIRARIEQQALPYTTAMATKDRERDQRMIMLFTFILTLCAIVLGLQSVFTCTCNLNF